MEINAIKSQFPIFTEHPELVYLDNAATSQKPWPVLNEMADFYKKENASVHRGLYDLAAEATSKYEAVRGKVAELISADDPLSIAFTHGTTESINIVANSLRKKLKAGDSILITAMEHHANLIPWQVICKETGASLKILPVTKSGDLEWERLDGWLTNRPRLLAVTHISNVLGTINPIEKIIALSHQRGVPVLVDAAQSAGHWPVDVTQWKADFVTFSAHKMFGPMGTGVLYVSKDWSSVITPLIYGGGAIRNVELEETEFLDYPNNLEAGTANVAGVIGLGAAIDFIRTLDQDQSMKHCIRLAEMFRDKAVSSGMEILGKPKDQAGIVSFYSNKIHPHDIAAFLASQNIAVRAGHHCAQPLLKSMGVPATVRVSFSIYNSVKDVDTTIEALAAMKKFWA